MSFFFTVTLSQADAISKDELRFWHLIDSKVVLHLGKSIFQKRGTILAVEEREWGSGGVLTDNADPHAPYWDMKTELLPEIAYLMKLLRQNTKFGFWLQACWVNEYPLEQIELTIDEMAQIIEENRVGTRTRYFIR